MKKDLVVAAIIGFLCAVLILPIASNLEIKIVSVKVLLVFLPLLSAAGMLVAGVIARKIKVMYQVAKFILVGALNTFVDWGVLNLLMFLTSIVAGYGYTLFKGASFAVGLFNSYFWNKFWTFKKRNQPTIQTATVGREFLKFFIVSAIGFILNVGTATLIVNVWGPHFNVALKLWANIGAFGGTLVGLGWNFTGYKLIVFKA